MGQKRSKPVGKPAGKPAELLKRVRYGRKRKAEAGEKLGERSTFGGVESENESLQLNSLGCKCRLRGCRSNQKTEAKSVLYMQVDGKGR